MEIKSKFDHFNVNVTNLEQSITFYEKALGLKESRRITSPDGSFIIVAIISPPSNILLGY
jgi:lactoylglutathione lyase